jgi:leucyl/phenylalanyl-tRNA--protein transferase
MGDDWGNIRWYSCDPRCIFDFDNFHVPRRLARTVRQRPFDIRVNTDWHDVVSNCAHIRDTTWISKEIYDTYTQLHAAGFAHTVEAWQDGVLVGGLYGVTLGGAFFGESMFHRATDASKVCLVHLVERLKQRGFILLDSQWMTTHLATLGAVNISRDAYMERLERALQLQCSFAD